MHLRKNLAVEGMEGSVECVNDEGTKTTKHKEK
jgi:hypothetical protein